LKRILVFFSTAALISALLLTTALAEPELNEPDAAEVNASGEAAQTEQATEPVPEHVQTDYMLEMIWAAVKGDYETGLTAEEARDEKIRMMSLDYQAVDFEEMYLLAKIMYAEAGSNWLSDEWKMCVGEVVLNRVASPEFPDTIRDVLEQPGQYYGKNSRYFEAIRPDERCVKLALRLLEGERQMDSSVVFQANFRQGSGVHTSFYDKYLGWSYFCFSSKPELYAA